MISLTEFSSNTNPNCPMLACSVVKFLRRNVDRKHLMRLQNKTCTKGGVLLRNNDYKTPCKESRAKSRTSF